MKCVNLLALIFSAAIMLTACCGDKLCPSNTHVLQSGIYFTNFTAGEMDSVQIREYWASSNFTNLMDSIGYRVYIQDSLHSVVSFDSAQSGAPDSVMNILIYMPHDSLIYKVTNINHQVVLCSKCYGHRSYGTTVSGYEVNGATPTLYYDEGGIRITK